MAVDKKPGCIWLGYALASMLFFGVTNFFLGYISEKSVGDPAASVKAAMVLWLGCGLCGVIGAGYFKLSRRGFSGLPGNFRFLPMTAGFTLALGMFLLKTSLAANPLAKGPIVAVTSSNSLVVALLAWMIIKEKLSPGQWAGFLVIVAGILLISLGGGVDGRFGAVGLAVAAMLLFGITNFLLKLAGERGCDSVTTSVVLWLLVGACGIAAVVWHWLARSGFPGLGRPALTWLALLAGVFMALGMLCIKKAVTLGQAGPAAAVSGSNAILVSLLDYSLLGHWLPPLKLAGMLTAIAGIVFLALARPLKKNRARTAGEI